MIKLNRTMAVTLSLALAARLAFSDPADADRKRTKNTIGGAAIGTGVGYIVGGKKGAAGGAVVGAIAGYSKKK